MTDEVTDREVLQELADRPIGVDADPDEEPTRWYHEAKDAMKRAGKVWLPSGKRSTTDKASREAEAAFYANQIDLEDAVVQAGGSRGSARR